MSLLNIHDDEASDPSKLTRALLSVLEDLQVERERLAREIVRRRRVELKFRSTVESAPLAMVMIDESGNIVLVNTETDKLFGYERDELLGQQIEMLVPERYRADHPQKRAEFVNAPVSRRMGSGRDLFGLRKNGSEFPVEIGLNPVQTEDGVFVLSAIVDITERKEFERTLVRSANESKLLHRVAALAADCDSFDQMLQETLDAFCEMMGWPIGHAYINPEDRGNALYPSRIWHLDDPALFADFVRTTESLVLGPGGGLSGQVLLTGRPIWVTDLRADPNCRMARKLENSPIRSAFGFPVLVDGKTVAVLEFFSVECMSADENILAIARNVGLQLGRVVERNRSQEALERHARELERSNRELEQFAYAASHDLQEPLRHVASCCQVLLDDYSDRIGGDGKEWLGLAINGANRMQVLVKDLLAYSRVGRSSDHKHPVDVGGACRTAIDNLRMAVEESEAQIECGELPTIVGVESELISLFQNLIGNALKYRGASPPRVEIGVRVENHAWLFYVKDNGIGVPPEFRERVFGVFQRLHRSEEYSGTGIGLAICKKIVEQHGGRIWVESTVDVGSTFYFTLPRNPAIENGSQSPG